MIKNKFQNIQNKLLIFVVSMIFFSCFFGRIDASLVFSENVAYASVDQSTDLEEELEEEISQQLALLDFDSIENVISNLSQESKILFSSNSFKSKINYIISGDYVDESQNFFSAVGSILWGNIRYYLPLIATIISISILGGMVSALKPMSNGSSINNIVHFVTYGFIVIILGNVLIELIKTTSTNLTVVKNIFDAIFPILLTVLTALGGSVSVGLYQPLVSLLSNVFVSFVNLILFPLFIFSIVFSIVGNLSNNIKLEKFVSFLQSTFKWSIGLCFTIFLGFISIQGIVAGNVDGLSIRTAKYAIKSYIPIVGGYVSDGLSIITASSVLIKNAVGGVGLFLLLSYIVSPILSLVVFMLSMRFVSGIIEPIGDKKIANFVSEISKSMTMLVALLVAVSFMYVVVTGLVMCSANIVF